MQFRPLGSTGISVSTISFGAGPVSGLLTSTAVDAQQSVIARSVELGVNWFDTAATYGNGQSEANLGAVLASIRSEQPLHVATKVRVQLTTETDLRPSVVASVRNSLERLRLPRVTLLQIHNSITRNRNDQPTSITPDDVLGPTGLLAGMEDVRVSGLVEHFGLTGIGDADALETVMHSGRFATIQAPLHLLNPRRSDRRPRPSAIPTTAASCGRPPIWAWAFLRFESTPPVRCLAPEPSSHTLQTPFFPLALYRRDQARAQQLAARLGSMAALSESALRYVLSQPQITSAIVGLGAIEHIKEASRIADMPLLSKQELVALEQIAKSLSETSPPTIPM